MIEISGLWLNESKDGKTKYLVGYMGSAKILIFKNNYKKEDKHPDWIMYVDAKEAKKDEGDETEDVLF